VPRSYQVTPAGSLRPVGGTSTTSHDSRAGHLLSEPDPPDLAQMVTLTLSSAGRFATGLLAFQYRVETFLNGCS